MTRKYIEIVEHDDSGNVTATYVETQGRPGSSRVDVILPKETKSPWQKLLDVFLPAGFPHSVTEDYLEYQIYDSLQAFASSIAGLLSSRAVLSSVGVGDATASPTAALLLSILQESAGRIATIIFAHRFGTSLEPECKMYRLLADVLNDLAFILDCLSPAFPKAIRVVILSFSSVLRALCGVAAGSAKASLSAHFARWGNLGELNAKDSSQETVISLLGMLAGSVVVSYITTPLATWTTLILLLSIHLETNRRAVRAVRMRTLNRQRATIVFHQLCSGHVPTPEEVSRQELIFERDGVLRDAAGVVVGHCDVGTSMRSLLKTLGPITSKTGAFHLRETSLTELLAAFDGKAYIMTCYSVGSYSHVSIGVKKDAKTTDVLVAWWQALMEAEHRYSGTLNSVKEDGQLAGNMLKQYEADLRKAGWDLDSGALETTSSTRISVNR